MKDIKTENKVIKIVLTRNWKWPSKWDTINIWGIEFTVTNIPEEFKEDITIRI